MKRSIFILFLFCFYSSGMVVAVDIPIISTTPKLPSPFPRAPGVNRIPVTATLSDTEVTLGFNTAVGLAIITITDETGFPVYQDGLDTDTNPDLSIPINEWNSGNYTLTIQYVSNTLTGNFTLYY